MLKRWLVLLPILLPLTCAAQTPDDRCPNGTAFKNGVNKIEREISGFHVRIAKEPGSEGCRFEVRDRAGRVIAQGQDVHVEALPEMYVLRIGTNDLVIETFSGGAHCCWTYNIVTQLPTPHLAAKITNGAPVEFLDYRGIELNDLVTRDAGFDYFDYLAYATNPAPTVYLRFVRARLTDAGSLFKAEYDEEVSRDRAKFTAAGLARFRAGSQSQEIGQHVLHIVLSYLYSGREEQAWKELAAMWPPADVERIKREILKTREKGILRYTRE